MKNSMLLILFCILSFNVSAQNQIIRKNGEVINCQVLRLDSTNIYFSFFPTKDSEEALSTHIPKKDVKELILTKEDAASMKLEQDSTLSIGELWVMNSNLDNQELTAGDELIRYSNTYYTGLAINSLGLIVLGYANGADNLDSYVSRAAFGSLLIIAGSITQMLSHSHIKKAGKIMNKNKGTKQLQTQVVVRF